MSKYPLEDLTRVREEQAAQAGRELAAAGKARREAEDAVRRAESRLLEHRRGMVAMMEQERWSAGERAAQEKRDEEASLEAWRARR